MAKQQNIIAPNGKTYTLTLPDDATELDAYRFAELYVEKEAQDEAARAKQAKEHESKTGGFRAAESAFLTGSGHAAEGAANMARLFNADETAQSLERKGEELKKKAASAYEPTTEQEVKEAYEKDYLSGLGKSFTKNISEPVGSAVGGYAPLVAATSTGNPLLMGAATLGEVLRGAGESKEQGASDINAALGGAAIGAVNVGGASKALDLVAPSIRAKAEEALLKRFAKNTAVAGVTGAGISIADEDIARATAEKPLMTPEEMGQAALEAAKIAPVFGAAHTAASRMMSKPVEPPPVVNEPAQEAPADNITEPTVRGKTADTGKVEGEPDTRMSGAITDAQSVAENFDMSRMPASFNIWNIRDGKTGFKKYANMDESLDSVRNLLHVYKTKHNIDTPLEFTNRYAPRADRNDPEAYAKNIADHLGLKSVNDKIDLDDPNTQAGMLWAIIQQEGVLHKNKGATVPLSQTLGLRSAEGVIKKGMDKTYVNGLDKLNTEYDADLADAAYNARQLIEQNEIPEENLAAAQEIIDLNEARQKAPEEVEARKQKSTAEEKLNTAGDNLASTLATEEAEPSAQLSAAPQIEAKRQAQERVGEAPLIPESLQQKVVQQHMDASAAQEEILKDPSTRMRDKDNQPKFVSAVKDTFNNFLKKNVDKWAGLSKINEKFGDYVGDKMSAFWLGHTSDKMGAMLQRAVIEGGIKINPDGQPEIRREPIRLSTGEMQNASLRNMYDLVKGEPKGLDTLNEILWVKDQQQMLEMNPEAASARAKEPSFQKKVAAADAILAAKPVYQDALNMNKKVSEMRVDFLKQAGMLSDDMYDYFKKRDQYVPNYEFRDEVGDALGADTTKKIKIGNTATRAFRERVESDHDVNPLENISNEMVRSYLGGYRNFHKGIAADQLHQIGAAETVNRTKNKGAQGNFAVLRNGEREFYNLKDPTDYPVMQVIKESVNPIMMLSRGAAQLTRAGATNTPGFWLRQMFIDPISASLTSDVGWVTPAHTMYEVTKLLTGKNDTFKKLMDRGVIGHVDPTMDPREARRFYKELGTRALPKTAMDKVKSQVSRSLDFMHILVDGATRCAVYDKVFNAELKKGTSRSKADSIATMKAREVINFSVGGSSEAVHAGKQLIPFLGSTINALEVMRRNLTMGHVKAEDREAYRKQFLSKVYTVGLLSGLHALYMSGDPDYEDMKNKAKYSSVPFPTGDKDSPFFNMPIPQDLAPLYWLPALLVHASLGTKDGQEVWKIAKDQMLALLPGGIGYSGGVPIPQIAKVPIELATGVDFYTSNPIVNPLEKNLPPEEQGKYSTTETSKAVSKLTGVSAPNFEHAFRGYLSTLGAAALWLGDGMIDAMGLGSGIQKPEKPLVQTPGLGFGTTFPSPQNSQAVEDLYTLKDKADGMRNYYGKLASTPSADNQARLKELMSTPESAGLIRAASMLDSAAKHEADIAKRIHMLESSSEAREKITEGVKKLNEERIRVAKQATENFKRMQGIGMAEGGSVLDKLKKQKFGPKDSLIASALMHPQEAGSRAGEWLQEKMRQAAGRPYEDVMPEEQVQAGLDLAGLANTGAMPFMPATGKGTLGIFAGLKSNTADLGAHETAKAMEAAGKAPEEILKATGWQKNPDEGWRYEISDQNARMKLPMSEILESPLFGSPKGNYVLGDVLHHPELYKAYPDIANVPFTNRRGFMDYGGLQGWRGENQIGLTPYVENPLSTLIHEAQHEVQNKENFAAGGNQNTVMEAIPHETKLEMAKEALDKLNGELREKTNVLQLLSQYKDHPDVNAIRDLKAQRTELFDRMWQLPSGEEKDKMRAAYSAMNDKDYELRKIAAKNIFGLDRYYDAPKDIQQMFNALGDEQGVVDKTGELINSIGGIQSGDIKELAKHVNMHEMYKRLAGETEARNTEFRRRMSPQERIATPSWTTQEYPYEKQFITKKLPK